MASLAVQKLYGRDVANAEAVSHVFQNILGKYSGDKVISAFALWLERSSEFPTPADIVNLIKRNGKPPLDKSVYIAIQKKDVEFRTASDWQYLRDYEAEQNEEFESLERQNDYMQENVKLRKELSELKNEINRLNNLLIGNRNISVTKNEGLSLGDVLKNVVRK